MRLATKFILIVAGILSVTLALNAYFFLHSQNRILEQQLTERGRVLGHLIALISPEAILGLDFLTLNEYAREVSRQRDVVYGVIVDNDDRPLTSYVNGNDPLIRTSLGVDGPAPDHLPPPRLQTLIQQLAHLPDVIPTEFPILHDGRLLGRLRVGISREVLATQAREQLVQQFGIYAAIILFLSAAIYLVFKYSVMRPVQRLMEVSQDLGRGEFTLIPVTSGDELGRLGETFNAMTHAIQREQAKLHYQANYDALTAQPNRMLAVERLQQEIRSAHRQQQRFALMFIDLDDFKIVNDTMGHAVGDRLLAHVSTHIRARLRDEDTLARLGGDEFLVLLPRIGQASDARDVAGRLLEAVSEPVALDGREVVVHCSIGIALYPEDGETVEALMANADNAMYQAKKPGRTPVCFFTAEMNAQVRERLQLEQDLNKVLARGELQLAFQPIFRADDGAYVGAEALLRWRHPEQGFISPATFIPLAESTGQIVAIGEWVLREAGRQLRRWLDAGLAPGYVAVNLSRVQLREDLEQLIGAVLDDNALPPHALELEITENILLDDHQQINAVLGRLHAQGLRFSLDDFGTGYSSLSYLRRFSFDTLKIDRSFVAPLCEDAEAAALVRAIVAMAHSLSLKVIAEGVETRAQLGFLQGLGCDYLQGYLLSRPLDTDHFTAFLTRLACESAPWGDCPLALTDG
ncbi:putative bifunctional diguanylate cyclase/phosphodiesterase [Aromatoleum diolicum]|uniref:EAL domain-containing protein n=1 Tax=Aromatoleum diolicum TaxID=75796 RepID=A0ABX1QIU7_9RHOO|nr:EAL domain-containing protein [Aromatoleum diolicum]NMG77140.1 EAL domain-containing protein [Aromatoleum diolicum]